jgi:hypothetical protein
VLFAMCPKLSASSKWTGHSNVLVKIRKRTFAVVTAKSGDGSAA